VLRALAIVDALAAHPHGATPKTLSSELGIHLSTTYHLLNTLVTSGYVVRDTETRLFQIGPRIPYLQHRFQQGLEPDLGVAPFLAALNETTGDTVHLGRLRGDTTVVVATLAGRRTDAVPAGYVGYAMPAHATALGQVLLARSSPAQRDAYLARADFSARPPLKATTPDQLRLRLESILNQGYAIDPGGQNPPMVGCVAAPICLPDGSAEMAMSVIVPIARYRLEEARLVRVVVSVARAASEFVASGHVDEDGVPDALLEYLSRADWIGPKIDSPPFTGRRRIDPRGS
jgi:DNA-binding IclR family transcriptional regulator